MLRATDQKPQKSLKRSYYSASRWHSGNMMVGNITFLMIFAVFDPSSLTLWINCSFFCINHIYVWFNYINCFFVFMNRFRTAQGPCLANLHKWGLAQSPSRDCGQWQTMNHCRQVPVNKIWKWTESASRSCHLAGIASDCNNRFLLCHVLRTFSCLGPSGQRHYVFEMCMRRHSPPDLPSTCSFCIVWSSCTVS